MKAQSLLTRRLFRAISQNRPYRIPGCPLRRAAQYQSGHARLFATSGTHQIFGLSLGGSVDAFGSAKPTSANIQAASSKLIDLINAKRKHTRPPSDGELIDAFRFLFTALAGRPKPLTRTEAFIATETLDHLQTKDRVLSQTQFPALKTQDLQNVLLALSAPGGRDDFQSDYQSLAATVFKLLRSSPDLDPLLSTTSSDGEAGLRSQFFESYVTVLARTGASKEALDILQNTTSSSRTQHVSLWVAVLEGLVQENKLADFQTALLEMQQHVGPLDIATHEELCVFLASRDEVEGMILVFESRSGDGFVPSTACLAAVLSSAVGNGRTDLAASIASQLSTRTDLGHHAGTLMEYYATLDPSVKHIQTKAEELLKIDVLDISDMSVFNVLIKFAYSMHDPVLAQRYIDLAKSYGLRPDAITWLARLDFDLLRYDLDSAAATFDALSLEDIPGDRSDVPVLNRYITAIASAGPINNELLLRVLDSILETGQDLEPNTVAGLFRVYLRRDDLEEASNLLKYRIDTFDRSDRACIGAIFEEFILDRSIKDQHAWNAYDLLRHALPETPVSNRITIMKSFFDRKRPDRACVIFGHMRQSEDAETRPTAEAYVQCFQGIAKCRDFDGLQLVYNMLKMDLHMEQTTKIHNAVMQAYTACRAPSTSITDHFWKILESREGPTLSSFLLAFQACETWVPQGSQEARRIMALMQKWDMVITKEIYNCYVGAIAGQSEFENSVELIENMAEDIDQEPDALTIGTFYNAIPFQYRKDAVEKWAKERYPELWQELVKLGDEIDEEWEIRYFKIDRTVDLDDDLLFGAGEYRKELAERATLRLEEPRR